MSTRAGEPQVPEAGGCEAVKEDHGGATTDATASDGASSVSPSLEEGYPKPCLLTNCILPGRPLFNTSVSLHDHMQVCIPGISKKRRSSPQALSEAPTPVRHSTRVTSIPLRVCLDHETTVTRSRPPIEASRKGSRAASNASPDQDAPGAGGDWGVTEDTSSKAHGGGGGDVEGSGQPPAPASKRTTRSSLRSSPRTPSGRKSSFSGANGSSVDGGDAPSGDAGSGDTRGLGHTSRRSHRGSPRASVQSSFNCKDFDVGGGVKSGRGKGGGTNTDGDGDAPSSTQRPARGSSDAVVVSSGDGDVGHGRVTTDTAIDGGVVDVVSNGVKSVVGDVDEDGEGGAGGAGGEGGEGEGMSALEMDNGCLVVDASAETATVSSNMSIDSMSVTSSSASTPEMGVVEGGSGGGAIYDCDDGSLQWSASVQMESAANEGLHGVRSNSSHSAGTMIVSASRRRGPGLLDDLGVGLATRAARRRSLVGGAAGEALARPVFGRKRGGRRRSAPPQGQSGRVARARMAGARPTSEEPTTHARRSSTSSASSGGGDGSEGAFLRRRSTRVVASLGARESEGDLKVLAMVEDGSAGSEEGAQRWSTPGSNVKLTWRGSLGTWGDNGAFTCPVNPCEAWKLVGCGRENRPRDTKCESCSRIIRLDWHVGAASIGSGVDNPQLRLACAVTFQNKNGLTYEGKVVAIDPTRTDRFPRGRVRVKYNDWPYDRYDEDCPMELVTPKGLMPTPLGRAGRRQVKPVNTFTPMTESHYMKRDPYSTWVIAKSVGELDGGAAENGLDSNDTEDRDGDDDSIEGSDEDELEEEELEPAKAEVVACKHVREDGEEVVFKSEGLCRICYKAFRKARAGIKMCKHVKEGARAYGKGRGPGDWGRGHCRECTLARFPIKKVKVSRPRLWPTCSMPGCRKRHFAWGMCSSCVADYKEKHPNVDIQKQHVKRGKVPWKFYGDDLEFTDSSDDEAQVQKTEAPKPSPPSFEDEDSAEVASSKGGEKCGSKRTGATAGTRQSKRARRSQIVKDDPTCFYCQRAEGRDARDLLLECACFECSRNIHMSCVNPRLEQVPERFYCPICVAQGKDVVCERPCIVCNSDANDDMMLVCDRECGTFFHTWCLPQPMDAPPDASVDFFCPICTGEDLERCKVVSKTSGGVRPAVCPPNTRVDEESTEKERRCGVCSKKCAFQIMWKCCSGKAICRGLVFHRKCLAQGIDRPDPAVPSPISSGPTARATRSSSPRARRGSQLPALQWAGADGGRNGGWRVSRGGGGLEDGAGGQRGEVLRERDPDGPRLCCPLCGFDRLERDVVDVPVEEEIYDGTPQQEGAYRSFERALRTALEDPKYGIGRTRDAFEAPFKGSIGTGANRKAMYGSLFEGAVDEMFRKSKLKAHHKFLDIGCGIGSIVLQAAAWAGCQAAGIEIVEERYDGAVRLHEAFHRAVRSDPKLAAVLHPDIVEKKVHLFKGCFLEQWNQPGVKDANFIFFNNSSGWFNNSKALNNPDDESLEARLLQKLKNDPRNNGKILVTLEHIAEWQPTCWERRQYKYSSDNPYISAATYAGSELTFWEYKVVSQWECPGCTSLNSDAVNDCVVCGTYCRGKRVSTRL